MKHRCSLLLTLLFALVPTVAQPQDSPQGIRWREIWLREETELTPQQSADAALEDARRQAGRSAERRAAGTGTRKAAKTGFGWLDLGIKIVTSGRELQEAYDRLTAEDADFDPDYTPPGMPQIPSLCADNAQCQACFRKAQSDLNFYRFYLEKLRAIYQATKTYADKSIAFGNSVSGIHGASGLAWHAERVKIEKSVAAMGRTYDDRYRGYMEGLQTTLQELGQCEAQFADQADWYDRYGFMYYSFMADRYRR